MNKELRCKVKYWFNCSLKEEQLGVLIPWNCYTTQEIHFSGDQLVVCDQTIFIVFKLLTNHINNKTGTKKIAKAIEGSLRIFETPIGKSYLCPASKLVTLKDSKDAETVKLRLT